MRFDQSQGVMGVLFIWLAFIRIEFLKKGYSQRYEKSVLPFGINLQSLPNGAKAA